MVATRAETGVEAAAATGAVMGRKNRRQRQEEAPRRGRRRTIRREASESPPRPRGPDRAAAPPRLHLRHLTAEEALIRLETTVRGHARLRTPELLVVHGRGLRSPGGEPVLGPLVRRWCDEHPQLVASWRPAPAAWGGEGAIVLNLRPQL